MWTPKNIINCYIPKLIVGRCDSMESKIATGVDIRKVRGKAGRTELTNGLQNGLSGKAMGKANRSEKKHGKILVEPRELGRGWNPILDIAVLCLLVLGVFAVLTCQNQQKNTIATDAFSVEPVERSVQTAVMEIKGTAHNPIHINGNSGFTDENGVTGGSGTEGDPYIIENLNIDANGGTYCIWIENTDVWFVIRNCMVWNATDNSTVPSGRGIYLNNVTHGTLENNNCTDNFGGIHLVSSSGNIIMNNDCSSNSDNGLYLSSSSNYNTVTNNSFTGNSNSGIFSFSSSNNLITCNNCSGNSAGILLILSSNNAITGNNCSTNSYHGICMGYFSKDNDITYNNCSGNSYCGLLMYNYTSDNIIAYNNFCCNTNYSIYITSGSTGNIIHHNNFWQNNGATKGTTDGRSQAYDDVGSNYWYDNTAHEGNYWSNWDSSGAYPIDGGKTSDAYPLSMPVTPELSPIAVIVVAIALLGIVARRFSICRH